MKYLVRHDFTLKVIVLMESRKNPFLFFYPTFKGGAKEKEGDFY
jgi:hypothetical protein